MYTQTVSVFQISCESVHFLPSYSRTHEHRQNAPKSESNIRLKPIFEPNNYIYEEGSRRYQTSPVLCNRTVNFVADNRLVQFACNQASAPVVCMPLHGQVQFAIIRGIELVGQRFSPKIGPSPPRIVTPLRNILFLVPSPLITLNGISIGSAVFV